MQMIQGIEWSHIDPHWNSRTRINPNLSPERRAIAGDWAYFDPWTSRYVTSAEAKSLRVSFAPPPPRDSGPGTATAATADAHPVNPVPMMALRVVEVGSPSTSPSTPAPIVTTPGTPGRRSPSAAANEHQSADPSQHDDRRDPVQEAPSGRASTSGDIESARALLLGAGIPQSEVGESLEEMRRLLRELYASKRRTSAIDKPSAS